MYQALYRKYRPQTFDEVVGQEGITRILKSQLQTGRLSHAYLFTGSRGTGKTSCAKIMAKAVNCLDPQDGNPCNRCAACLSIDSGTCMDVLEIDAASNNGVDNVRDLRDDAIYSPSQVRYRVYIVDEVHMLSISAFNALLKIIEEPPEHLIFILATTELHKVPATILSRCQRFSFRRISPEDVAGRLQYVAYQEGIDLDPTAAVTLGRLADGAMRDGVSLLDQCASATVGPVTEESVYQCLGLAGTRKAADMMEAVARRDTAAALTLYDRLYTGGKDVGALLDELCALARDLLILKTAPKSGLSMLSGVSSLRQAQSLKDAFSTGELVRLMELLQTTAAGFTRGGKTRTDGELCVIRMCQPELSLEPDALNARLTRLEEAMASGVRPTVKVPEPEPEEERPPLPDDADAPPADERETPPQQEVPMGFWTELVSRVQREINPAYRGYFKVGPDAMVTGVLKGQVLELRCSSRFVFEELSKPELKQGLLDMVSQKASAMLGNPVRAVLVDASAKIKTDSNLQGLLDFGRQHQDIVKIK